MNAFAILALILLALIGNILWYWLKFDLKNRGYKIHYFYGHFNDLANAAEVIEQSDEPQTKRTYRWVLYTLILVIILMPTIFFMNVGSFEFGSFESHRCKRFNDYLNYQVTGTIESKFIDKPNHALETLNLTNGQKENEVTIFVNDLYTFLQPGDSISKMSGNSEIIVYRNGHERTFNVDQAIWCVE